LDQAFRKKSARAAALARPLLLPCRRWAERLSKWMTAGANRRDSTLKHRDSRRGISSLKGARAYAQAVVLYDACVRFARSRDGSRSAPPSSLSLRRRPWGAARR